MADVIFHHYGTSPYSEKVRLAFGAKNIPWRSVTVPNIMPKPDVLALTGAYRKTPVMQIGADIYCDTACIGRELERRYPEKRLYPAPETEAFASWVETKVFGPAVALAFAYIADSVPQEFKDDRAKFSGRDFNPERMRAMLPHFEDQVRAVMTVLDEMLSGGKPFLFGAAVSIADLAAYHPLWFIATRAGAEIAPLSEFPRVRAWMERVKAIGHGTHSDMTSAEAIAAARAAKPDAAAIAPGVAAGWKSGDKVTVTPDDTGRDPTPGEVVYASAREIVIRRTDDRAGTVHVHFPRLGFIVARAK
jgi:glutathione S-transferase